MIEREEFVRLASEHLQEHAGELAKTLVRGYDPAAIERGMMEIPAAQIVLNEVEQVPIQEYEMAWVRSNFPEIELGKEEEYVGLLRALQRKVIYEQDRAIREGEKLPIVAADPEPPVIEPVRHRCDEQKKAPKKVTNSQKRKERDARRKARRK